MKKHEKVKNVLKERSSSGKIEDKLKKEGVMKKYTLTFILFIFAVLLYPQTKDGFQCQLEVYQGRETLSSCPLTSVMQMSDGDRVRVYVGTSNDAYCYVIEEQPNGIAKVLYNAMLSSDKALYLPGSDDSYTLGMPDGMDRFHIVVSASRQKNLERLLEDLGKNEKSPSASRKVLDEIATIGQSVSSIVEQPVKPALMGASTRGLTKPKSNMIELSGASVYVKTIRIKH